MPIDYSKWDNITLSSDEEEEEIKQQQKKKVAAVSSSATTAATTAVAVKPPSTGLDDRACGKCEKIIPYKKVSWCSRCKLQCYCSRECQVSDWKHHKQFCKRLSQKDLDESNDTHDCSKRLFRLLEWYSDKVVFRMGDGKGCIEQKPRSLSSVARDFINTVGQGVVVLTYEDSDDVMTTVYKLKQIVKKQQKDRKSDDDYPVFPTVFYQPWPPMEGKGMICGIAAGLARINVDLHFKCIKDPKKEFVLAIQTNKPEPGFLSTFVIPFNPSSRIPGDWPVPVKLFEEMKKFIRDIQVDTLFENCRTFLIRNWHRSAEPGVVWIPNLLYDESKQPSWMRMTWTRGDFKKIEPGILLKAMQRDTPTKKATKAENDNDIISEYMEFVPLNNPGQRMWMPYLVGQLDAEIKSPDILVCAFMGAADVDSLTPETFPQAFMISTVSS